MSFNLNREKYLQFKKELRNKNITLEEFTTEVNKLSEIDPQGNLWMIGVNSGKWYRHDGSQWVEDTPPENEERHTASQPSGIPKASAQGSIIRKDEIWLWVLILILLVIIVSSGLLLILVKTDMVEISLPMMRNPTSTSLPAENAYTKTPLSFSSSSPTTSTPQTATQTPQPSREPFTLTDSIIGRWDSLSVNAYYQFFEDGSYVFYQREVNIMHSGEFSIHENTIDFQVFELGEIITTKTFMAKLEDENTLDLSSPGAPADTWVKIQSDPVNSRNEHPLSLLFETSRRLEWSQPDPDCPFNSLDEESEYELNCLYFDDGTYLTWLDQSPSAAKENVMERSIYSLFIYHETYPQYADELQRVQDLLDKTDNFHGRNAYSLSEDMDTFLMEQYAWINGPWLYVSFRIDPNDAEDHPHSLKQVNETLYEVLNDQKPYSNAEAIPTPSVPYLEEKIIGTWVERALSLETMIFDDEMNVRVYSTPENYDHSGTYEFPDKVTLTLDLDYGEITAEIEIIGNVLYLVLDDDQTAIYDRVSD